LSGGGVAAALVAASASKSTAGIEGEERVAAAFRERPKNVEFSADLEIGSTFF
jgi:hypothetical protein